MLVFPLLFGSVVSWISNELHNLPQEWHAVSLLRQSCGFSWPQLDVNCIMSPGSPLEMFGFLGTDSIVRVLCRVL